MASHQLSSAGHEPGLDEHNNEIGIDQDLWLEWLKVISDWPNFKAKQSEHIKELVRKGVPTNLRPKIWKLLANAQQVTPETSIQYNQMLKRSSDCEKLIQRDTARTYPEIDYFKDEAGPGQEGLFNVIKAYSLHDEEVGYCQGSAFIVGLLLLQLSEEETFMLLCKIMQDYRMRELYKPTMAEMGVCIYQLECLVQEQLPELHVHFQTQNFDASMYSSSWFLTLFTSILPLHLAYRVMDLFLSEGLDMIFDLSMAILQICKEDLLKFDMEGLMKYFQKEMPSRIEADPDYLIKCACQKKIKYDSKRMKKLYRDHITSKNKDQEEITRLKNDNSRLQDILKRLEVENKELADKLIQGQVCRAQEAEDAFIIRRELCQYESTITKLETRVAELEHQLAERTVKNSEEALLMIEGMQMELNAVKLRDANSHDEIEELNKKITEQELYIKSLRENVPEDPVAQLQEELSAVKLREAEANFAMRELRSKLNELQALWLEHQHQYHGLVVNSSNSQPSSLDPSSGSPPNSNNTMQSNSVGANSLNPSNMTNLQSMNSIQQSQPSSLTSSLASSNPLSKFFNNSIIKRASGSSSIGGNSNNSQPEDELQRMKQDLLSLKLQEADSLAEVKMLRSREMELETQIKIQENKFKRKEDEFKRIERELESERVKLSEVTNQLKVEQRKLSDIQFQGVQEQLTRGLKDVEHTRLIGELKQKISSLEIRIEEMNAAKKLAECGTEPKDASEYQERVAELQSESFRLDASNRKLDDIKKKNSQRELEGNIGKSDESEPQT